MPPQDFLWCVFFSRNNVYHCKVLQGQCCLELVTWAISISPALISFLYGILILNGTIHYNAPNNTQWEIFQPELSVGPWTSIKPVQTAVKKLTHEEKRWNASWIKLKSELVIQQCLSDAKGYRKRWEEQVECSQVEEMQGGSRDLPISPQAKHCVSTREVCGTMWRDKTRTLPL